MQSVGSERTRGQVRVGVGYCAFVEGKLVACPVQDWEDSLASRAYAQ